MTEPIVPEHLETAAIVEFVETVTIEETVKCEKPTPEPPTTEPEAQQTVEEMNPMLAQQQVRFHSDSDSYFRHFNFSFLLSNFLERLVKTTTTRFGRGGSCGCCSLIRTANFFDVVVPGQCVTD